LEPRTLLSSCGTVDDFPVGRVIAELSAAMSLRQLGRAAEARAAFGRADTLIESRVPHCGLDDLNSGGLENWLMCFGTSISLCD
jgi:hypothetical protein